MNKRTLAAVAGLGAAALAVTVLGNTRLRETIRAQRDLSRQLQRQYPGLPRAAPLDFRRFEAALGAFATEPRAAHARQLLRATLAELQQALASGRVTAEDLVLAALARIRETQHLNAVIELNPDILILARLSDAERRAG
ncbi:MAG TPA: hypothetical protein VFT99_22030, partial [Roseiflexaceae bacterium]|nr:hypothetical protein [Roseiflexaceae bacterium]